MFPITFRSLKSARSLKSEFFKYSCSSQIRFLVQSSNKQNGISLKQQDAPVFTHQEIEAAKLARKASLGPYISKLPEKWIPYAELMRLEKPIGTWYLLIPSTWSIVMAAFQVGAPLTSTLYTLGLFSVGALLMRGAGCTVNDILDRNFDNKVARTIERPLASKKVSVTQAVAFLGVQCFAGLGILLQLPFDCWLLGALSVPFFFAYPLFKRFTYYPQAWLSLCFGWGTLLGFPAMGIWNLPVMLSLFMTNFCWIMTYDTIYAHQDKKYDIKAGVKSTALAWGANSKRVFYRYTAAQITCYSFAGYMSACGPGFILGGIWGFSRIINMIKKVDLDDPSSCFYYFRSYNMNTGHILSLGMIVDYILRLLNFI